MPEHIGIVCDINWLQSSGVLQPFDHTVEQTLLGTACKQLVDQKTKACEASRTVVRTTLCLRIALSCCAGPQLNHLFCLLLYMLLSNHHVNREKNEHAPLAQQRVSRLLKKH